MTIRILGSRPPPEQRSSSPLSATQLVVVLSSLLHGLTYATLLHAVPPHQILSWSHQQEEQLWGRLWLWRSKDVAEWVLRVREQQVRVSEEVLLQLGRSALGEEAPLKEVLSWTVDLLLRHELQPPPYRLKHHRGRTLPTSIKRGSRSFLPQLLTQIQRLPPHCIGSMDEFPIFLDQQLLQEQSPLALRFFGSPEEEPVFHVVLSALSDGSFLPPLVLFRGEPVLLPSGFPDNVLLEARQEAVSEQERLLTWVHKVWRPLVVSRWNTQVLLLLDVHLGHLTDQFRGTMSSENTELLFIPPSCSCRLQPLNVCVTPVLRDFLQARWGQLLSEGSAESLSLDQLALTLGCWISEASSLLNAETHFLRRSFSSVSDPQQLEDRSEASKMIFALIEALLQHAEPEPEPGLEPEPKLELLLEDGQAVIDQVPEKVDQVSEKVDQVSEKVDQVPDKVDQVPEEVENSKEVDQEVMDQVSEEVEDQVSEEVEDQVSEEVMDHVSEEVMDQISEEVEDQVSEEVMDQVSEEVMDQVSEEEVLIESQSALEQEFDSDLDSFHSFSDES